MTIAEILELLPFAAALAVAGLGAGVLAGVFGVGGGIIIVPALYQVLTIFGVDEAVRMHLSVATSLAIIVPTSLRSVAAHAKRGAVNWDVLKLWAPAMALGTLAGGGIASLLSGEALTIIFGVLALIVAIQFGFGRDDWRLRDGVPRGVSGAALPATIGLLSALMGIGGGTFSVTAMTLCGISILEAVATSAGLGFVIALPGALAYMVIGWGEAGLPPASIGYVNFLSFLAVAPATVLGAPLGVSIAHRLPRRALRIAFASFLALTSIRMLIAGLT